MKRVMVFVGSLSYLVVEHSFFFLLLRVSGGGQYPKNSPAGSGVCVPKNSPAGSGVCVEQLE